MKLEYASSLEEMSSLSVTSAEAGMMPGPTKNKPRDILSKYQQHPQRAETTNKSSELKNLPQLTRKDDSFKIAAEEQQEKNKLVELLWKRKWQDLLDYEASIMKNLGKKETMHG